MALFSWVVRTSILASILVVFILLLKILLRERLGPKWHYYIWFLVLLRLIIPIDLQSPVSIYNYISTPKTASVYYDPDPREHPSQPQGDIGAGREPGHGSSISPGTIPGGSESFEAEPLPPQTLIPPVYPSIFDIAFYIWLAGVIILMLHMAVINFRYLNAIRRNSSVKDEGVLRLFEESKEKFGIRKGIPLIQTDRVNTTTLYGFIQPRLLLPAKINEKLSLEELRYIFYHELSHIKQKDIPINLVSGILQILHWFNPVLWYGFFRMRQDREVACDALALSFLHPQEYKKYGKVIIDLIETYSSPVQLPGMIGIVSDGSNTKKRIAMISAFRKNTYRLSVTAIVLLLIFGVVFLTSAGEDLGVKGRGNTVGNLVNGGFYAQEGDWIYYSNFEDEGKLYKKRGDGSGITLLSPDPWIKNINVLDGWVYYVALEDDSRLYRVKADGSRREPLNDHNSASVTVIDDTIYYASLQQEHDIDSRGLHIYSMALDGGNQKLITALPPDSNVIIHDGWIYYADLNSQTGLHNLYRIGIDGEPRALVSDRAGWVMNVVDGWVYYSNEEGIKRISTAGESYAQITGDEAVSLNVAGDWIYYIRRENEEDSQYLDGTGEDDPTRRILLYHDSRGGSLFRVRVDGTQGSKITDAKALSIHILQNQLIYYSGEEGKFASMNLAGLADKEGAPAAKPEEPRGNTTGNIANGGLVAYSEGWIYYSNLEDGGKLYKKREDGSGVTLLSDNPAVEINVVGDWVYYNSGKHLFRPGGNIYKVRTDGTQEIRLNEQDSRFVQVVGDWIYYIGFDMENRKFSLYKMKTDGGSHTMIVDKAEVDSFFVVEDWIYYTDIDRHGLSRIKTDGSDYKFLTNRHGSFFNLVGDWVYFLGEGDRVYRRSIDGSSVIRLSEDAAFNINVKGDWIYYIHQPEAWSNIYRMRTDGSQRERINDERSLNIFVAGDWIYYTSANDFLSGYRKIRIDSLEQTGPRAGESVDGEDVRKKLEEIAVEVLGKAPISTSDLATDDDMTTPGVESVRYNKYIPYSRIIFRSVPNSGVEEEILAQIETEIIKLLEKITEIPEIDVLIGDLIVDVCLPTEERVYGEPAEIWKTNLEIFIKGETLAQTNWREVDNGKLWEIADIEYSRFDI